MLGWVGFVARLEQPARPRSRLHRSVLAIVLDQQRKCWGSVHELIGRLRAISPSRSLKKSLVFGDEARVVAFMDEDVADEASSRP